MRHFIAIAEIMGLPNACVAAPYSQENGSHEYETQLQRAKLWQSLCFADGISGVVLNLPPSISPYQRPNPQPLVIDGAIQPQAYIGRLIEITAKIRYRDSTHMTRGSKAELYASVLELDRELKVLAAETPNSWWIRSVKHAIPDHLVQFLHWCISMRIHLAFTTRKDSDEEYSYSRMVCIDACESVTEHYRHLRQELPSGFFLSRCLDLQAFIATVILLLTSHSNPGTDQRSLKINKVKVNSVVTQTIEVIDERSKNTAVSHLAQHCVTSIRSLKELLQQNDRGSNAQELTLKIPLLGKVHIRRNRDMSQMQDTRNFQAHGNPNEQWLTTQEHSYIPPCIDKNTVSDFQTPDLPWDPLSWCIEDHHEDFFQDALMADTTDLFAI